MMQKSYTLSLSVLLEREKIRDDKPSPWMNKMTDEEIRTFEEETEYFLESEGVPRKFPDWNAAFLSRCIDLDIIYNLLRDEKQAQEKK